MMNGIVRDTHIRLLHTAHGSFQSCPTLTTSEGKVFEGEYSGGLPQPLTSAISEATVEVLIPSGRLGYDVDLF